MNTLNDKSLAAMHAALRALVLEDPDNTTGIPWRELVEGIRISTPGHHELPHSGEDFALDLYHQMTGLNWIRLLGGRVHVNNAPGGWVDPGAYPDKAPILPADQICTTDGIEPFELPEYLPPKGIMQRMVRAIDRMDGRYFQRETLALLKLSMPDDDPKNIARMLPRIPDFRKYSDCVFVGRAKREGGKKVEWVFGPLVPTPNRNQTPKEQRSIPD